MVAAKAALPKTRSASIARDVTVWRIEVWTGERWIKHLEEENGHLFIWQGWTGCCLQIVYQILSVHQGQ